MGGLNMELNIQQIMDILPHRPPFLLVDKIIDCEPGVKATGKVSVNMVDEAMLERADYVGCVSGAKVDKSEVFAWHPGEAGAPVIDESPLVMECEVVDNYETDTFDNFICKIANAYAEESVLNDKGKPDYSRLKPVLFEMPGYTYLRTGEEIAPCTSLGKALKQRK